MANLTGADLETMLLDTLQCNVTTDPPIATVASAGSVAASKTYWLLNQAYSIVWEGWGGGITKATSATLWSPAQSADTTGTLAGVLTTTAEILHLWSTSTSGSTGGAVGDNELDRVDMSQITFLRSTYGSSPPYAVPKVYCVVNEATATAANVGKLRLEYWPGVSGLYFPGWYIPHFTALAATTDVPDVPDLAQRDIALVAAYYGAPLIGRSDFLPGIAQQISERSSAIMKRRESALIDARQDR